MPDELMTTGFRRAGHRARLNARCFRVGTVTDPTMLACRILRFSSSIDLDFIGIVRIMPLQAMRDMTFSDCLLVLVL
jgi:hypothetical protein